MKQLRNGELSHDQNYHRRVCFGFCVVGAGHVTLAAPSVTQHDYFSRLRMRSGTDTH